MAQLHNYHVLLKTEATRRKLPVRYSEPKVVNGSINPPPSRFYPGKRCYMVTASVNDMKFHGFGPSETIAKSSASYEAYKKLFDSNEAPSNGTQETPELFEIADASSQETPISSQWLSPSPTKGDGYPHLCSLSNTQSGCIDSQCQVRSPSTAQKYYAPQTRQDTTDQRISSSAEMLPQGSTNSRKRFGRSCAGGVLDRLLEQARKKGVEVQFETVHTGGFVTVRASAGLSSREVTSKKANVAKCIALQELMEEVDSSSPVSGCGKPVIHATDLPTCVRSSDPVGQLNEAMTESKEDIQFSFCCRGKGFWCCAMVMNKSSLGFGTSKQQAKEMAAQNMLSLLWYKGINVLPQHKSIDVEHSGGGSQCEGSEELPYTDQQPPPHPLEQMLHGREASNDSVHLPHDQHLLVVDAHSATGDRGLMCPSDLDSPIPEEPTSNLSSMMTDMSLTNRIAKKSFLDDTEMLCGTDVVLSSEGAVCLPSAGSVDLYKDMPSLL